MNNEELRRRVVEEALTWVGTPYHVGGRIKGAGIDCATFILQVFVNCGVFSDEKLSVYSGDWWAHANEEQYLFHVLRHATKILETISYRTVTADPGNIVLVRTANSRVYNHGAIVVDFPRCVHAITPVVGWVDVTSDCLWGYKEIAVFDPFVRPEE